MKLHLSAAIRDKLSDSNHRITESDLLQCFANAERGFIEDDREEHRTDPRTLWFVSQINYGVKIKVMFVIRGSEIYIKSAYRATDTVSAMYDRKSAKR